MKTANSEVIDRVFVYMGQDDLDAVARLFTHEIFIHEAASLPYGGTYQGVEGFFDLFGKLAQEFDNLSITPNSIENAGPFVVALTNPQRPAAQHWQGNRNTAVRTV
jgi:hypothetical protein